MSPVRLGYLGSDVEEKVHYYDVSVRGKVQVVG